MGLIKLEKLNKKTSVFYEYRLKEPYTDCWNDKDFAFLKHVMIYYDNDFPITFVVTSDEKIKGILYKEKVFSEDLKNIINLQKHDMKSLNTTNVNDTLHEVNDTFKGITQSAGAILMIPIAIVMMPFVFFNLNNYE